MSKFNKSAIIQGHNPSTVIATLGPYVTVHRKERIETVLSGRLNNIQLVIEAPSDINNALAAVRSSEALGISKVHIICPEGDVAAARTITQGAIYWVEVIFYASLDEFLEELQKQDMRLAGGMVNASMPLGAVPIDQPLCIMVGNEQRGLSAKAMAACDIQYKIPMFGMTESFNLSVSAAVSLYDVTRRKREYLRADSDLTPAEQEALRAQFYLNSTSLRLAQALLKRQ